ncbi:MAG: hypothetical protein GWN58_26735, partial [Anaerolineae bacterium]|nr:hypothetical protein [Anaerolineae bacterium]
VRPDMTRPVLRATESFAKCAQHLPLVSNVEYHCIDGESGARTYLLWDVDPALAGCVGEPLHECKSYEEFLALANGN